MELRHLRYFVAVAEELHFHRAATRLHISQPPLSQQIRALERELGVTLLARNRRRVALTAAGESFRDDARSILAAVERASERARDIARGAIGTLSIGFVGSAMFSPTLPDILREFRSGHPDVELVLRELPTVAQLNALAAGELDIGVIRGPVELAELDGQLELLTIQRERLVAALPSGHPLASRRRLRPGELRGESFVILARREAPGLYAGLATAMGDAGGLPDDVLEVAEMQTIISLVAGGFGVSLVPASVGQVERSGVTFLPISGPTPTIELALAWRRGTDLPVRNEFLVGAGAARAAPARRRTALRRRRRAVRRLARSKCARPPGCEDRSRGPCTGRRGKHSLDPLPWYVQYSFFLAVDRFPISLRLPELTSPLRRRAPFGRAARRGAYGERV